MTLIQRESGSVSKMGVSLLQCERKHTKSPADFSAGPWEAQDA